mmetsp:Transcript_18789/g.61457  ORF Transcript_18789/g.61457 Transcript_18789/m.61457 type:complete len:191 (-) Transcript_18789:106-678(-)
MLRTAACGPPAWASASASPRAALAAARVPLLRAQASDEDEYLADLEQQLRRAAARSSRSPPAPTAADGPPVRRTGAALPTSREGSQVYALPGKARAAWRSYIGVPGQLLLLSTLSLLVGFYLAGSLSTIFGAAGFWEPVIGLPVLLVGEVVTREYYLRPAERRPVLLKLANALKVGFYLGVVVDAIKLAG